MENREWWQIDCSNQSLGRVATKAARLLMGKNKAGYAPHLDVGDHVVVTNLKNVVLTGNKMETKKYYSHSGYRGGLKVETAASLTRKGKEKEMFKHAVVGMLPKNTLAKAMVKRLHIYLTEPEKLDVKLRTIDEN